MPAGLSTCRCNVPEMCVLARSSRSASHWFPCGSFTAEKEAEFIVYCEFYFEKHRVRVSQQRSPGYYPENSCKQPLMAAGERPLDCSGGDYGGAITRTRAPCYVTVLLHIQVQPQLKAAGLILLHFIRLICIPSIFCCRVENRRCFVSPGRVSALLVFIPPTYSLSRFPLLLKSNRVEKLQ